jgi:ubiquinone/menaquinone biosynthesis C-methylase UbiE/uncharacterized protein YbaR (Trm112 family)
MLENSKKTKQVGDLKLVCPTCHGRLEFKEIKGLTCTLCHSEYPFHSATVPVLVKEKDRQAIFRWLGGVPGKTEDLNRYVEARSNSPLTVMYYDWWTKRLMDMIPRDNYGPIAELMCGRAELIRRLPERFSAAAASDINLLACEDARRDLDAAGKGRISVFCASAGCLPFEDQSLGIVAIQGGLHHARPILTEIFQEIHRVLKPGGVFVGSEPANDSLPIRILRKIQYRLSTQQGNDADEDGFNRDELSRGLEKAGLRMDYYTQFGAIAYVLMGNTDLIPILAHSKNAALGNALLRIDEVLERLPCFRAFGMASLFKATKENTYG